MRTHRYKPFVEHLVIQNEKIKWEMTSDMNQWCARTREKNNLDSTWVSVSYALKCQVVTTYNTKKWLSSDLERLFVTRMAGGLGCDVTDPSRVAHRVNFHRVRLHLAGYHSNIDEFSCLHSNDTQRVIVIIESIDVTIVFVRLYEHLCHREVVVMNKSYLFSQHLTRTQ